MNIITVMSDLTKKKKRRRRAILVRIAQVYIFGNILFFILNPFASPWHYQTRDPEPITVTQRTDSNLSVNEISRVLDEIDLHYGARKPSEFDIARYTIRRVVTVVFFPASATLHMRGFVEYIGPANSKQRSFTVSVKKRYNHLARLALKNGMEKNGYLFVENSLLSKQNAESFHSLRGDTP